MAIHKAEIVKDTVEHLGSLGMAFTVICCGDETTAERHTIGYAHLLTDAELLALLTHKVKEHARAHLAAERNIVRAKAMLGTTDICHVCDEKSLIAPKRTRKQKAT